MQLKDIRRFGGLNKDDNPTDKEFLPDDYTDASNVRVVSSNEELGIGILETLQGEIEVILNAESTYYGGAIGGQFVYEGFEEVRICDQVWMKRNYDKDYPGSKAYNNVEANAAIYGRLYDWNMLYEPDFLPAGWRVPTEADIDELLACVGGALLGGGKLKEYGATHWQLPNTGSSDLFGFTGLPGGMFDTVFDLLGEKGGIWMLGDADPGIPVALPAENAQAGSFDAMWLPVIGVDGYYLTVSTDPLFGSTVPGFDHIDTGNVTSYLVDGLVGTTFYYYLTAYNDAGESGHSNIITVVLLLPPVTIDATNYGHNRFDANWNAAAGALGYRLDVATDFAFTSLVAGFSDLDAGNVTTYDVTGLDDDIVYYYRVRSYNATALSVNSNITTAITPESMLITSRGTGLGVARMVITADPGLTITVFGSTKFYSDTAGTLNESSTWTNANGIRYVRCPSGTSELFFSHIEKVTAMGNVSNPNSGTGLWNPQISPAPDFNNTPSVNLRTYLYPNCIDLCLIYGAPYVYLYADITELSTSLVKVLLNSGGNLSGTWADIPNTCTIFSLSAANTVSGDTSDISANMVRFYTGAGSISKTGDVADLPAGMLQFEIYVANIITGDIADFPANIEKITLHGSNTISGDIAGTHPTITYLDIYGYNTLSGDIADLPANILHVAIAGYNTIHGDLVDIPSIVNQFTILGSNTINGGFTAVPITCSRLVILGVNTIDGDLSDLPNSITYLSIKGNNTVTGDLSDLNNNLGTLEMWGSNTITGNLSDLPTGLYYSSVIGLNTLHGDLANIPANCNFFFLTGSNTVSDYTHKTWSAVGLSLYLAPATGGLSSAEVDQLLIDIDTDVPSWYNGRREIILLGANAARTGTSNVAVASLIVKGVTVTTN